MAPKASVQPYVRPKIKDPADDPVIAMARDRRAKELKKENQARMVSGLSGGVLHKQHELKQIESEIKLLEEGVQEYQDQINLLNERKNDRAKSLVKHKEWCATFDVLIGARLAGARADAPLCAPFVARPRQRAQPPLPHRTEPRAALG